jgi:hypothetical protein
MEKLSKVLTLAFVLVMIASVGFTFYKTVILEDFAVVYCDYWEEDGVEMEECYDEIPPEWLEEEEEYDEEGLEEEMSVDDGAMVVEEVSIDEATEDSGPGDSTEEEALIDETSTEPEEVLDEL